MDEDRTDHTDMGEDTPGTRPQRPVFGLAEAAKACQVSTKTVQRRLPQLVEHGAVRNSDGGWSIPVEALLAVGLHPGRTAGPDPQVPAPAAFAPDTVTISRAEYDRLRADSVRAEERERTIDLMTLALRQLEAATPPTVPTVEQLVEQTTPTPAAKKRWWGRSA